MKSIIKSLLTRSIQAAKEEGLSSVPRRGWGLLRRHTRQLKFKPYLVQKEIGEIKFSFILSDIWAENWYLHAESRPEILWLQETIKPGMRVLDCGAHHGFFAMLFAKLVGDHGEVYSIEALPSNARIIKKNIDLNGQTNITVINKAVSSEKGELWFATRKHGIYEGNGHISNVRSKSDVRVDVTTIDELFPQTKFDALKIDIEGLELNVLRRAGRILDTIPILDIEIHCSSFLNREQELIEILSLLALQQYECWIQLVPDGPLLSFDRSIHTPSLLSSYDNLHLFARPVSSLTK
jgi:FkbM family methyltransferase